MEERLRQNAGNTGYLYDTLKVYLMMDDPERFDARIVKTWLEQEWQTHLPRSVDREQRDRLTAHLDALLHDHAVDYGLWNKLYAAELLREDMLDNGLAYNEDLLANWRAFLAAPGCAFCDFAGYHYRQHADSASHRALPPQSIDDQRRAAAEIRATAPAALQESVNAFYYEKLVYLASMILRRANADAYRVQLYELQVAIRAGAHDPQLGRNPQLPRSIRLSAFLTLHMPRLWRWACRTFLKDRQ